MREGGLLLATVVLLVTLTVLDGGGGPGRTGALLLAGLSVLAALPLPLRARHPLAGALLSAAVTLLGLQVIGWPGRLVTMAMFGAAAYHLPHRPWLVPGCSVEWTLGYGLVLPAALPGVSGVTDLVVMGIAPVAVGRALRLHSERARHRTLLDQAETRRAVAEERAALARDVHDSVGHHLTAIHMQATATRRTLRGSSATADTTLGTIADLSTTALREVRALLGTLRDWPSDTSADLEGIEELARRLSIPPLRITVRRDGPHDPLPPGVAHTVYRVAQEALTNAVRHARATEVVVSLRRDHGEVTLAVRDNGPAVPHPAAQGRGLRGMTERVLQHGGTLMAGPRPPGGWLVQATVPIAPAPVAPPVAVREDRA